MSPAQLGCLALPFFEVLNGASSARELLLFVGALTLTSVIKIGIQAMCLQAMFRSAVQKKLGFLVLCLFHRETAQNHIVAP